jgi:hypothetical protein
MSAKIINVSATTPELKNLVERLTKDWSSQAIAARAWLADLTHRLICVSRDYNINQVTGATVSSGETIFTFGAEDFFGFTITISSRSEIANQVSEESLIFRHSATFVSGGADDEYREKTIKIIDDALDRAFFGKSVTEIYNKITAVVPDMFWVAEESGFNQERNQINIILKLKGNDECQPEIMVDFANLP